MINYELFEAAVPPLCGGDWLIKAAQASGLGPGWLRRLEEPWELKRINGAVRLTMVRDPVRWLEMLRTEEDPTPQLGLRFHKLLAVRYDSFEEIARAYLYHCPGAITDLFARYRGNVVERFEDQPWAFDEFLQTIDMPPWLRSRMTTIGRTECRVPCPRWARHELRRVDRRVFETYDY